MTATNGFTAKDAAWQLHLENIALRARAEENDRRRLNQLRHCVYCGAPSRGPVCLAHSDLIEFDDQAPGI